MLTVSTLDHPTPQPISDAEFAAGLDPLGPFGPNPLFGLAVSGGADSVALALLTRVWVEHRGGRTLAFIVDHGLRPEARAEAEQARGTLTALGVPARILTLSGLEPGPGVSERARVARYRALAAACREAGIIHLLLGHHAADQAETLLMRAVRGSGSTGLAGMAPLTETTDLRFLRPLLGFPPGRLRARLRAAGTPWAEDPTNADARFTRARLRALRADAQGCGPATRALTEAAGLFGTQRAAAEQETANFLAAQAEIRPEGFAHVSGPGPWPATALAQLLRMVTGAPYPPDPEHIARIAADPSGAIGRGLALAGARLLPAGRQGLGFLLCREESAMAAPVPAVPGAIWDGRFRVMRAAPVQSDMLLGALGDEAAGFRRLSDLPAAVLRTMPALRDSEGTLRAVPGLGWHAADENRSYTLVFAPLLPAAGAIFAAGLGRDLALRDRGHGETVPPP